MPADRLGLGMNIDQPVRRDRLVLALQRHRLDRLGCYRVAQEAVRGLANQDLAGLGGLLEPGGHVDGVPGYQRLPGRRIPRHHLAGVQAGPGEDGDPPVPLQVSVQAFQPLLHLEGGSHGAKGVVLVKGRDAEHRHDGISDELLHRPAVRFKGRLHLLEVASHDLAERLRIKAFAQTRRPGDVGEQHGDNLPRLSSGRGSLQRPAASQAEPGNLGILLATGRTDRHETKV